MPSGRAGRKLISADPPLDPQKEHQNSKSQRKQKSGLVGMNPTRAGAASSARRLLGSVGRCQAVRELEYCGFKVMGEEKGKEGL